MTDVNYAQLDFPYAGITPTSHFKTTLYPHQEQTVEWMLYREEMPYENVRGGLVLSQMGTGKSVCALACVVLAGGLTLVAVPAQLVYVWESEIKRHFKDLSYFIYHGPDRKKKFEKYRLKNGDPMIIIMSLQSVPTDIIDPAGPLQNMQFHRIIFDECHYIKNQHTEIFQAVSRIQSTVKWFLSGTPIMNKIQEMYPYLKLLNYKDIAKIPRANRRIRGMYGRNDEMEVKTNTYIHMQELLRNIAIRRTKEILNLPPKTYDNVLVNLNTLERQFYVQLQEYSRERVRKLLRNIKKVNGSALLPGEQNRLRVIILQCMLSLIFHLRIACCDPLLVIDKIPRCKDMDMEHALEELSKDKENDCPVCYNNEATVLNTECMHWSCPSCWEKLSKIEPMRCFVCFEQTSLLQLRDYTKKDKEELKKAHDERIFHRSSKTKVILHHIKQEVEKGNKVVVVSQWTSYLDRLISAFKTENRDVAYILLDGKTIPIKRQKIVDQFQDDQNIKVCFASLGSSAEGITLHAACSMILCDVYWNAARIDQISDRIHRIGQVRDVTVHKVYVLDSIEMKLKDLVEKKDHICRVVVDCAPVSHFVEGWLTRMIKLID